MDALDALMRKYVQERLQCTSYMQRLCASLSVCTLHNFCVMCSVSHKLAHFRIWQYKSVEDNMFPPVPIFGHFAVCTRNFILESARAHTHMLWMLCVRACMWHTFHGFTAPSNGYAIGDIITIFRCNERKRAKYAKLIAFHSTWLLFFSLSLLSHELLQ